MRKFNGVGGLELGAWGLRRRKEKLRLSLEREQLEWWKVLEATLPQSSDAKESGTGIPTIKPKLKKKSTVSQECTVRELEGGCLEKVESGNHRQTLAAAVARR